MAGRHLEKPHSRSAKVSYDVLSTKRGLQAASQHGLGDHSQKWLVGLGQTAAATCGTHTVYTACQPRWSSCFQIHLKLELHCNSLSLSREFQLSKVMKTLDLRLDAKDGEKIF